MTGLKQGAKMRDSRVDGRVPAVIFHQGHCQLVIDPKVIADAPQRRDGCFLIDIGQDELWALAESATQAQSNVICNLLNPPACQEQK